VGRGVRLLWGVAGGVCFLSWDGGGTGGVVVSEKGVCLVWDQDVHRDS